MASTSDTIAAIATAAGQGGVGIIRLSGSAAIDIALHMAQRTGAQTQTRHAHYATFKNADGDLLDTGLLLSFLAPHSYTGENCAELQVHGAPAVLSQLLRECVRLGARLAEPGEFTRRAYLNRKLDLNQAEAVADLIAASSETAARAAVRSLSGEFSRHLHQLQDALTHLRLFTEATLDFPEEDIEFLVQEKVLDKTHQVELALDKVLLSARHGRKLNEGLAVVIAGAPNVGKSSLLNHLCGEDLAIVTPIAGTTRDSIKTHIEIEGVRISLTDTAGLRDTTDVVERIGIDRARSALASADLIIALCEIGGHFVDPLPEGVPVLLVHNKADLTPASSTDAATPITADLAISARTGMGIDKLKRAMAEKLALSGDHSEAFIARARHVAALENAAMELMAARLLWAEHSAPPLELFAEHLRLAQASLSEILGEFSADDLLGEIFSRFCIGK
ncbi:MAG: tRNA modification GTPase TrmE [Pseudomonadota bacterium]|jgi:tRNA modification GTPase